MRDNRSVMGFFISFVKNDEIRPSMRVQHRFGGCGMTLKIEAGCGIREILKVGCGMKTERRDRDILRFVGGIRDRTGICEIIS